MHDLKVSPWQETIARTAREECDGSLLSGVGLAWKDLRARRLVLGSVKRERYVLRMYFGVFLGNTGMI